MAIKKKKAIILNHMFTGDYLVDNIGHEVINLFADDDERNFIYLCKDGEFNRDDIDIENSYVIQVRRPVNSVNTLEIISVAVGIRKVDSKTETELNAKLEHESETKPKSVPTYGGKSIYKIFENNLQQQECCVTFIADKILTPKNTLYISHGDKCDNKYNYITSITKNPSQQLREYLLENTDKDDYKNLLKIIDDKSLWDIRIAKDNRVDSSPIPINATDIYGIQTRELSFSNAFKYYINEYPKLFADICNNVRKTRLNCTINRDLTLPEESKILVYREKYNIDFLVLWDEYLFVIENKIFSGLNGIKGNITQLDVYKSKVDELICDENTVFHKKTPIYVVLTPEYNDLSNEIKSPWTEVKYNSIYKTLKDKSKQSPYSKDFLFCDFVTSLECHSDKDFNKKIMQKMFLKEINNQ